jgi:hypothetical protein
VSVELDSPAGAGQHVEVRKVRINDLRTDLNQH